MRALVGMTLAGCAGVIVTLLLTEPVVSYAPQPRCAKCHSPVAPIIKTVGQYRRLKQHRPLRTADKEAARLLEELTRNEASDTGSPRLR